MRLIRGSCTDEQGLLTFYWFLTPIQNMIDVPCFSFKRFTDSIYSYVLKSAISYDADSLKALSIDQSVSGRNAAMISISQSLSISHSISQALSLSVPSFSFNPFSLSVPSLNFNLSLSLNSGEEVDLDLDPVVDVVLALI